MSSNPHDALFKALVAQPEHARGALRAVIPPAIADRERLADLWGRAAGAEAKDIVMTAGERLIQQGRQEGIQQGRQEGEREVLLRQLRARFGNQVDASIERHVEAASGEQIGIWLVRVLSAATLAEIMAS
jgi:predicted transposase YdaD